MNAPTSTCTGACRNGPIANNAYMQVFGTNGVGIPTGPPLTRDFVSTIDGNVTSVTGPRLNVGQSGASGTQTVHVESRLIGADPSKPRAIFWISLSVNDVGIAVVYIYNNGLSSPNPTLTGGSTPGGSSSGNPSQPQYIGGLDLNGYCQSLGFVGVSLDGSTINDWNCVDNSGNHIGFDVTAACQWQYPQQNLTAYYTNFNDPNSWGCYASSSSAGPGTANITIQALIDGRSELVLSDSSATWQHLDFAAPGRWGCNSGTQPQPTVFNGTNWHPNWPDSPAAARTATATAPPTASPACSPPSRPR